MPLEKGLVQVYTGDGKGKTTCALGLCVRASGHGFKIKIVQFLKGWDYYGEIKGLSFLPGVELVRTGRAEFVDADNPDPVDIKEVERGLKIAEEAVFSGNYDIVILDEINVVLSYGLADINRIKKLIEQKPDNVELILTGRYAPREIIEMADLVTEMKEIKHPYQKGVQARKGIEF